MNKVRSILPILFYLVIISLSQKVYAAYSKESNLVMDMDLEERESLTTKDKKLMRLNDSFFDPKYDYSRFAGRVTDRDESKTIFKVESENFNIKFFRAGDTLNFRVVNSEIQKDRNCHASIRDTEKNHFVMYVRNISECWDTTDYFRRGAQLEFFSLDLSERIQSASQYRLLLLKRKEDFLLQLNGINNFMASFEQQKVLLAAEFDKKILALQKEKEDALDTLVGRKVDSANLQKELGFRLDSLEEDLKHYRIEKVENLVDRWILDQSGDTPVSNRPQAMKERY